MEKIDIQSYMIGNLVWCGSNYGQVAEIYTMNGELLITVNNRRNKYFEEINPFEVTTGAEDIRPIPLTEEFFEKNGFKFLTEDGKYKTLCLNEPYINCTFVKEFKDWIITVGAAGSVKKRFVEVSKVQFVHEFQHMLRLCGYEMGVVV